ncbi:MAG: hypothetical protein ACI959_001181 [Limisphaerales bacterium]|jgi:hypothetical protein
MIKYTTTTKKKIEQIYKEGGYVIRYERGNFNAGCCVLEKKKVVVINRFFGLEAQMNSLIEILGQIELDLLSLKPESMKMLEQLKNVAVELGFSEINTQINSQLKTEVPESETDVDAELDEESSAVSSALKQTDEVISVAPKEDASESILEEALIEKQTS